MATFPFTGDPLSQVENVYIGYFGRAGDPNGTNFWISALLTGTPLTTVASLFSTSAEAKAEYLFLANPQTSSTTGPGNALDAFINQVYQNLFGRNADGTDTTGGLGFWRGQILPVLNNPAALATELGVFILQVSLGAQPADAAVLQAKVTAADALTQAFTASGLLFGNDGSPADNFAHSNIAGVHGAGDVPGAVANSAHFATNPPTGATFTLTIGQDTFHGTGMDTFNAPLAGLFGNQATLTNGDNLSDTGGTAFPSVLNATFLTGGSGSLSGSVVDGSFLDPNGLKTLNVQGLNITGIATWNIDNVGLSGTVTLSGDSGGGKVISGLHTLNYDDHSGEASLLVGNNTQPVQPGLTVIGGPGSFDGFHLNVRDAVGTGDNGVNVDFAAQGFTGTDTIFVGANVVGGFPLDSGGSLIVPQPIIFGTDPDPEDQDNYNPNWEGFLDDAFAITAGASSGPNKGKNGLPPTGAVGFQNWVISSTGAGAVEPGIQFANFNTLTGLNIIALGGEGSWTATTLTLTDDGSSTMLFASFFGDSLLSDWKNLATIDLTGTSGFVILTGLEATNQANAIDNPSTDGGGLLTKDTTALKTILGGAGNSFYDLSSLTAATAQAGSFDGGHSTGGNSEVAFNNDVLTGTKPVSISHIQVLDDASDKQGGIIDMNNFVGLAPLNQDYTLLAGGVIPAGFQLLQLLNSDGSTEATLTKNLVIANGPTQFAINMQDVNDGFYTYAPSDVDHIHPIGSSGWDISIFGESVVPNVNVQNHLILYVSDGVSPPGPGEMLPQASLISGSSGEQVYNVPHLEIDNYTTVDIWIPFEHLPDLNKKLLGETFDLGHDVGLGTVSFLIQPVVTVGNDGTAHASVTFHDNTADTGASDPGGPDDLYIGHTQTYDLGTGLTSYFDRNTANQATLIGETTVAIDTFFHGPLSTTITDLGAGRLEIGATNVFILHAESTSHLVMDLPATGFDETDVGPHSQENAKLDHGITVFGSINGQNLLQGSSGEIHLDNANFLFGPGTTADEGDNTAYVGATADDTITGGPGDLHGNGDNIFGEGGNDTINLNHSTGGPGSTVWIGAYDVGYSGAHETGTDTGRIFEQAITDVAANGDQSFVNNYATSTTTINGFVFGTAAHGGDAIIFQDSSWGETGKNETNDNAGATGLVQWDGQSETNGGDHNGPTIFATISSASQTVDPNTDVVLDNIGGGYANAAALQNALTHPTGDIQFSGGGVEEGNSADLLIAYQSGNGITIADVTITNNTGSDITGTNGLNATQLQVHDLVHIVTTLGLANFDAHNLQIVA